MGNNAIEFIELVDYCANKCRAAATVFCSTLARHLNNMAGDFPQVYCLTAFYFVFEMYLFFYLDKMP